VVGDGWTEIFIPMARLDPTHAPFDRVVVQAFRPFTGGPVAVDKISLTKPGRGPATSAIALPVSMAIDCKAKATHISPLIYGMALPDPQHATAAQIGATASRFGGNLASTYNFRNDAWNSGADWFYENHEAVSATKFAQENLKHGVKTALTVPM